MSLETYKADTLTLELREEEGAVYVVWTGRSTGRDPGPFIVPVLSKAIELVRETNKPLILDFQNISFMNSSTLTPIIRLLDRARRSVNTIRILYKRDLKWQELNFSALEVFQTPDQRIEIRGV
jgi:hypothetical protein